MAAVRAGRQIVRPGLEQRQTGLQGGVAQKQLLFDRRGRSPEGQRPEPHVYFGKVGAPVRLACPDDLERTANTLEQGSDSGI
ncbi:MAG: hypothetical protein H0X67_18025 [Acidobacteria bacterium]|nr:hypothetical protein [Acidobacteriota bacterium]